MNFNISEQEFIRSIKKLKRSPKLGKIYEIYRMEQEQTLCTTTLERQNKVWLKHLSQYTEENYQSDLQRRKIHNLSLYSTAFNHNIRFFNSM